MSQVSLKVTTSSKDLSMKYPSKNTAQQLFEEICKNLSIRETWYFGLYYLGADKRKIWIDLSKKKVTKYADHLNKLRFGIKFYPEDVEKDVIENLTRRYFYYDIRYDILNENVYCPDDQCLLLASYVCQIKFGDHADNAEFDVESFIPQKVFKQHAMGKDEIAKSVKSMWKKYSGHLKDEMILEYLKAAQNLDMLGIHYYNATNSKASKILVGISPVGVNFYKDTDKITPVSLFPWSEIQKLSYRNKTFTIRLSGNAKSVQFFVAEESTNKQIQNLGLAYHKLYFARRKPDTLIVTELKKNAMEYQNILNAQKRKAALQEQKNKELEERYKQEMAKMNDELDKIKDRLLITEETILALRDRLAEIAAAKEELEVREAELRRMNLELEGAKHLNENERLQLQEEIDAKRAEVDRLAQEVAEKNLETAQLQEEFEEARRRQEELQQKLLDEAEARRIAEEAHLEAESNRIEMQPQDQQEPSELHQEEIPEVADLTFEFDVKEEMEAIQEKLQETQTSQSEEDKIHESNLRDGISKYQTLRNIRSGNTTRRIDLFENI